MPSLTREELRNELKQGRISPVYVLYGPEKYLRDLAAKTIADRSFSESDLRDFNDDEFSLNNPDNLKVAIAAAEQLPMMAARRVVRIFDVRVAASASRDTIKEDDENFLKKFLARPVESSVVIFNADELNGNRKIGKLLKEGAVAVEFKPLDEAELYRWAAKEIRGVGGNADEQAIRHIVTLVGTDVLRLTNEINKLATAALPSGLITIELVDKLIGYKREIENWSLTNNLLAGRKAMAMQALQKVLDDGVEPVMLLGLLGSSFRKLLLAKELMAKGVSRQQVVGIAKPPWGHQEEFFAFSRRADPAKLANSIRRIAATDVAIKTSVGGGGPIGSRMQIEMLVCELAAL